METLTESQRYALRRIAGVERDLRWSVHSASIGALGRKGLIEAEANNFGLKLTAEGKTALLDSATDKRDRARIAGLIIRGKVKL